MSKSEQLRQEFESACSEVKRLTKKPTDEEMLALYALYKQATVGDCTTERPGIFQVRSRRKHDAWAEIAGTSTSKAMRSYVRLVKELQGAYSD